MANEKLMKISVQEMCDAVAMPQCVKTENNNQTAKKSYEAIKLALYESGWKRTFSTKGNINHS